MTPALYEILYCSQLATGQTAAVVPKILAVARARNPNRQVTGVLVFDGMRFCQHFEGPRTEVLQLIESIKADRRHQQVEVVHHGEVPQRRYTHFHMGFAQSGDAEELASIEALDGTPALDRFLALLPGFDVAP
ncbi:MAG: BLUF domain-containing protein [Comamonadaceae bacterium]|nr:MAG: BLUF domain-containing protein [Comamonadaceae bacterium]